MLIRTHPAQHRVSGSESHRRVCTRAQPVSQQQTSQQVSVKDVADVPRRSILISTSTLLGVASWTVPGSASAELNFFERGLSKYIKKKRLDPLDTYVPVVLEARDQLLEAGNVMASDVAAARSLLRQDAFDGLRENIRVLGEYAVINKREKDAGPLVNGFFRALEEYDLQLATSIKNNEPLNVDAARKGLDATVKALDDLLATVPEDILSRSRRVLQVAREKERAALQQLQSESEAQAASQETVLPDTKPAEKAPLQQTTPGTAANTETTGPELIPRSEPEVPKPSPQQESEMSINPDLKQTDVQSSVETATAELLQPSSLAVPEPTNDIVPSLANVVSEQ